VDQHKTKRIADENPVSYERMHWNRETTWMIYLREGVVVTDKRPKQ